MGKPATSSIIVYTVVLVSTLLLSGCGYQFIIKAQKDPESGGTTIVKYNDDTGEVHCLDIDRYKRILLELYHQFFPDTTIDPAIEQSRAFDPAGFEEVCKMAPEVQECKQ